MPRITPPDSLKSNTLTDVLFPPSAGVKVRLKFPGPLTTRSVALYCNRKTSNKLRKGVNFRQIYTKTSATFMKKSNDNKDSLEESISNSYLKTGKDPEKNNGVLIITKINGFVILTTYMIKNACHRIVASSWYLSANRDTYQNN